MKTLIATLLLAMSMAARAEQVSIPCEEFVRITGKRIPCDKLPVIKMPAQQWEQKKAAAAAARNAPDADVPPWQRDAPALRQPTPRTLADTEPCTLPPWKRPDGVVCP